MKQVFSGIQWFGIVGTALAVTISFVTNHSVLWATIQGFFGWIYVIYYSLGYGR